MMNILLPGLILLLLAVIVEIFTARCSVCRDVLQEPLFKDENRRYCSKCCAYRYHQPGIGWIRGIED
jgi:hypothetical protein